MTITKEQAIELANEAGIFWLGGEAALHRLCNLAIKHAAKDVEPVAWRSWYAPANSYTIWQQEPKGVPVEPLYTHPAHDNTALLRQCLEALTCCEDHPHWCTHCDDYVDRSGVVVTALRERLGTT